MQEQTTFWHLMLGDAMVASIQCDSAEFPWTYGKLVESPEFEKFRVFFSDEDSWPETLEFEELCNEIHARGKFSLLNTATEVSYRSFRLNHDGNVIWFRYS